MLDFLRDPVWGGVGVLITLLITVGGQVILRRRRDESSRGSNARGFLRTFSAPKALIYAGIGCMFLGFVLPSDTWGSGGLFLLSVGVIFAAFLALKGLVRMIIDRRIGLPPTKDAARSDLVVGDKASIESGGSLTVYTFESPAASSEYIESDPGKEYSAIEVEWCAGLSRGEELERVRSHYFELQMPDNTRITKGKSYKGALSAGYHAPTRRLCARMDHLSDAKGGEASFRDVHGERIGRQVGTTGCCW
jgi:hypothetical protein